MGMVLSTAVMSMMMPVGVLLVYTTNDGFTQRAAGGIHPHPSASIATASHHHGG